MFTESLSRYTKAAKTAGANEAYRARFEARRILRRLPDEFVVAELREVMEEIDLKDSRSRDGLPRELTQHTAYNYAKWLARSGFIERRGNNRSGYWKKVK